MWFCMTIEPLVSDQPKYEALSGPLWERGFLTRGQATGVQVLFPISPFISSSKFDSQKKCCLQEALAYER